MTTTDQHADSDPQAVADLHWMQRALALAAQAAEQGEVPVGAVLVRNGELLAEGYNQPITAHDPTAHAEIVALRTAAAAVGNYRLPDTTLYVTLEPCTMCIGALIHARVARLVFAAREPRAGAVCSALQLCDHSGYNHKLAWSEGVLAEQSSLLLTGFFKARR
jgi:tRNA(adenine34) deaminase